MSEKRKNVIIFHAESWDGRMLGCLRHPALAGATPNIDALAARGVLFENAYTTHPICCPSRASMWSGKYTHNCEAWNNFKGLEPSMWALPEAIAETHEVGFFGKRDYRSGGHSLLARLSAWLGPVNRSRPIFDEDGSQVFEVDEGTDPRYHAGDWENVDRAVAFLREQTEGDRPFFLAFNSALVHAAFLTNRYWLEKIPAELVDIPPVDETDHPVIAYQRMAKAWRYGFDDETVREVRRIYFAMCAEADAMLGAIVQAVRDLGLEGETSIVFTSDHGELALEHQDWYKMSFYEGSARVPMVLAGPDLERGLRVRNLVSLIDAAPTLMELAGLEPRPQFDGESLLPLATCETTDSRDSAYAMFSGCSMNTSGFMLRKGPWKYIHYSGYRPQLFHLEDDPGELDDRSARDPETVREMDRALRDIVDPEATHRRWMAYNRQAFGEFRRQAKQGLYVDDWYGLAAHPSCDYWDIMDNAFTGWDEQDEARLEAWLGGEDL